MEFEHLFFQLLQVAIGTRTALGVQPTSKEWTVLFDMFRKQALLAVAFVGIKKLSLHTLGSNNDTNNSDGKPIEMGEATYLKWLCLTVKIAQRNKLVSAACEDLVKQYQHDGISCCILKGQGNLEYYPDDLRDCRTPGDIDVWCKVADSCGIDIVSREHEGGSTHYQKYRGKDAIIEYVKKLHRLAGTDTYPSVRYHHIEAPSVKGVDVEVHFRPIFLHSPLRNHRLQEWFRFNEQFGHHKVKIGDVILPVPSVSFNAVYQLCHVYRHLFDEGIGLRQFLDYYFVLKTLHIGQEGRAQSIEQLSECVEVEVKSNEEIMNTLSQLGMKKFAGAAMYVLQRVFAMPDEYLICQPNEKEGGFLLNEIMMAGNFGKYDERIKHGGTKSQHAWEKLKHNLRLLTHYPEEVIWEPFFRVYHWIWRKLELWRY